MKKNFCTLLLLMLSMLLATSCSNKEQVSTDLYPFQQGNKWGYITPKGEVAIHPQFTSCDFFVNGLARVTNEENKVLYIQKDGSYAFDGSFVDGTSFYDNCAFVIRPNEVPVCIDKNGNELFKLTIAMQVSSFSEGLSRFKNEEGKWGFVNTKGDVVINPQFDEAYDFCNGLARVVVDRKNGFISKDGKYVINPQFLRASGFWEDGDVAPFYNGEKYGYVNRDGKYAINPQFDMATQFHEGLAAIYTNNQTVGFIDKSGTYVINPQFNDASWFKDGLCAIRQNGQWGFVDKEGKIVINPQFERVGYFNDGYAPVASAGQYGIIDKSGKYVVNPQYEDIKEYSGNGLGSIVESDYLDMTPLLEHIMSKVNNSYCSETNLPTVIGDLEEYGNLKRHTDNVLLYKPYNYCSSVGEGVSLHEEDYVFNDNIKKPSGWSYIINAEAKLRRYTAQYYFTEKAYGKTDIFGDMLTNELVAKIGGRKALDINERGAHATVIECKDKNVGIIVVCKGEGTSEKLKREGLMVTFVYDVVEGLGDKIKNREYHL